MSLKYQSAQSRLRYCCNAHLEDKIRLSADRRMHNLIHLRRCLVSEKPCAATFNSESCRDFFFFFLGQTVVLGHICVGTTSSGLLYCIYVTGASLVAQEVKNPRAMQET